MAVVLVKDTATGADLEKIARFQYPQTCDRFVSSADPGRFFGSLLHDALAWSFNAAGSRKAVYFPGFKQGWFPSVNAVVETEVEGEGMPLAYDEPEWCAGKLWKWDCFFLPVTNCTVPPEMVLALKDSHQSEGFKGTVTWDGGKPLGEQLETVCEESVCAALETDARTTPYNGNFAQQFLIRPNYRTRREVMRIKREVTGRAGGPGALDAGRCVLLTVSLKFTD